MSEELMGTGDGLSREEKIDTTNLGELYIDVLKQNWENSKKQEERIRNILIEAQHKNT